MLLLVARAAELLLLFSAFWATGKAIVTGARRFWPAGALFADTMALGMGAWMAYGFVLSALSWVRVGTLLAPLGLALAGLVVWVLRARPWRTLRWPRPWSRPGTSAAVAICGLALALVLAALFVRAAFPSVSWDAAVYHLTLPKLFLHDGGFARLRTRMRRGAQGNECRRRL